MSSTATLLSLLTRLCWEHGELDLVNTQLNLLSKKHGQLKEAVTRMVDEAMTWLPELKKQKDEGKFKDGKDRWLELVQTLRDITEGKVSCILTIHMEGRLRTVADIPGAGSSSFDCHACFPSRGFIRVCTIRILMSVDLRRSDPS